MKEIRTILKQYDSIDHSKEKVALASIVQVEASAYRRIGARMLVQSSGIWTGGISGGCLEGDALRRSQKAIFENKVATVVYDTMEDDNHQIGVGLGCNGRIEVLLSPIDHSDPNNEIEILRRIKDDTKANLILKVVEHSDAALKGKVHLVEENVDLLKIPGIAEKELATNLTEVKSRRKAKLYSFGEDEEIKILIEFLRPETHLVIAGDNYETDIFNNSG
jgi:xanthine/CO dehydrogenase XdhC/CoxF family maturation factor